MNRAIIPFYYYYYYYYDPIPMLEYHNSHLTLIFYLKNPQISSLHPIQIMSAHAKNEKFQLGIRDSRARKDRCQMTPMRITVESWIDYWYGAYRIGTCYESFLVERVEKT